MVRVLHVGSGFRPWLVNGLVIYAEELMAAQVARGHSVGYFFPGRQYPFVRRPRLHRWSRDGVAMYEWMSSPLIVGALRGTRDPAGELSNADAEAVFARVLAQFSPQLVHVHDLGGLPSSLVDVTHRAGLPIVMTLHDYALLCPTVRLYDVEGNICLRTQPGAQCARCCADAPRDNLALRDRTIGFEGIRARKLIPGLATALRQPVAARSIARVGRSIAALNAGPPRSAPPPEASLAASPEAYQRRRDANVERLNSFNLLLALSARSSAIYAALGVRPEKLRRVRITAGHIERLHPSRVAGTGPQLTFGTLGTFTSRQKGADLLMDALRCLREAGLDGRYRLLVGGWVPPQAARQLQEHAGVSLHGVYETEALDGLLDNVDVGLMPSVWEEVSPLTGREFLAKGIPIVANALGGMVDYTRDGETGWLNRANTAEGLAAILAHLIHHPEEVERLSRHVIEHRAELVRPMAEHVEEMDAIYDHVLVTADGRRRDTGGNGLS